MMKTLIILLLTATITSSCSHTYYIVRHAEKDQSNGSATVKDPALSEAGKVRAIVLRDQLESKHIRSIFATNTIRAKSTAQPLSEAINVPIVIYSTTDSLVAQLNQMKRKNTLIVGHSNTVDDIINKLCGETKISNDLSETQFDNLFIITYKGKKIKFQKRKYGYPSNPE